MVELRRRKEGWAAERQHRFFDAPATTGLVAHAPEVAGITPKPA